MLLVFYAPNTVRESCWFIAVKQRRASSWPANTCAYQLEAPQPSVPATMATTWPLIAHSASVKLRLISFSEMESVDFCCELLDSQNNKIAQSNLGTGCVATLATDQLSNSPLDTIGSPTFAPEITPSRGPIS